MTRRNSLFTALASIALVLIFATPIGPLPGFFIGGTYTPTPAVWPDTSKEDEILLKVPGTLPRVVIIWVVQVEGQLYVVGGGDSGWVRRTVWAGQWKCAFMIAYSLTATPVTAGLKPSLRPTRTSIGRIIPLLPDFRPAKKVRVFCVFRLDPDPASAPPEIQGHMRHREGGQGKKRIAQSRVVEVTAQFSGKATGNHQTSPIRQVITSGQSENAS